MNIDFKMLKDQKEDLVNVADKARTGLINLSIPEIYSLEGIINLLDEIQDNEDQKNTIYYQPELPDELWGTNKGIYSFEVYRSKKKCKEDFPKYNVIEYSGDEIEEPTYID